MIKNQLSIIFSIILVSFISFGCSKNTFKNGKKFDLDTLTFNHSLKGWELYCWPNGKDWNYSILKGTKGMKDYGAVTKNTIVVCGFDSLTMLMDRFPANEKIQLIGEGWMTRCWGNGNYGNLCLPDKETQNKIIDYSFKKKLVLSIAN